MYKCEVTGELVGPGIALHKVTVEKRSKTYNNVRYFLDGNSEARLSEGWEIAKEINVSPDVYEKMTGLKGNRIQSSGLGLKAKVKQNSQEAVPWRKHNRNSYNQQPRVEVVSNVRKPR